MFRYFGQDIWDYVPEIGSTGCRPPSCLRTGPWRQIRPVNRELLDPELIYIQLPRDKGLKYPQYKYTVYYKNNID